MSLCFCDGAVVFLWLCFCGSLLVWWCGGAFVVVWLCLCVFVMVPWCFCGSVVVFFAEERFLCCRGVVLLCCRGVFVFLVLERSVRREL